MQLSLLARALLLIPTFTGVVVGGETSALSALRVAPASALSDLTSLSPATEEQARVVRNMGFVGSGFLGRTARGRLVFHAPRMHGIGYQIPSLSRQGFSEVLVARHAGDADRGSVQSFGYMPQVKWSREAPVHDLAFKVDGSTYLLADGVDTGAVSVLRAPEGTEMKPMTEAFRAHVEQRYSGPVTE